jgi:hypothetical protein
MHGDRVHLDARWGVKLVVGRRGMRVVGLLRKEVLIIPVWDRYRHGRLVMIRVLRGRVFRGRASEGTGRVRSVLVFRKGSFATEASFASGLLTNVWSLACVNSPMTSKTR